MGRATLFLVTVATILSCNNSTPKDFSTVAQGMSKQEVIHAVGEPSLTNDIEVAELWTYPDHDRTVVFRADTVYDIITSREARADSIKMSLEQIGRDIKAGAKKLGNKLDSAGSSIENKLDDDTSGKN